MAQVVGPVNSTANYADNVFSGVWSSGYLFARDQPILVEITYGIPGAPSDVIHDLPCPAGQSVDLTAPSSQRYPNIAITQVRFKSQGSQPATVTGYFAEPRAPGIIAGIGGTFGATALMNFAGFSVTGGTPTLLTGLPTFQLPGQYGGFWLGTTGQAGHIDVLVQTQSGTTPIGGVVTGDVYGFAGGYGGLYAVPSIGTTVALTVTSQVTQAINLAAVPIAVWPPPAFDPPQAQVLTFQSFTLPGPGATTFILPPYDGDAALNVTVTSAASTFIVDLNILNYAGAQIGKVYSAAGTTGLKVAAQVKMSHRLQTLVLSGTAGDAGFVSINQTPRRGGA